MKDSRQGESLTLGVVSRSNRRFCYAQPAHPSVVDSRAAAVPVPVGLVHSQSLVPALFSVAPSRGQRAANQGASGGMAHRAADDGARAAPTLAPIRPPCSRADSGAEQLEAIATRTGRAEPRMNFDCIRQSLSTRVPRLDLPMSCGDRNPHKLFFRPNCF
jgi:hypothetical protein